MTTRRTLLSRAMALIAMQKLGAGTGHAASAASAIEPAPRRLDLLFLGGTGFLGPHQIEYALARGHRVTMFNRGVSGAGMYGDRVEALLGNRDSRIDAGLSALRGTRRWDAVLDNSGYIPRHVRDSAELLKGRVTPVRVHALGVRPGRRGQRRRDDRVVDEPRVDGGNGLDELWPAEGGLRPRGA